jgi:hypothetical protein
VAAAFQNASVEKVNGEFILGVVFHDRHEDDEGLRVRFFATAGGVGLGAWRFGLKVSDANQSACLGPHALVANDFFGLGFGRNGAVTQRSPGFFALIDVTQPSTVVRAIQTSADGSYLLSDNLVVGRNLAGSLFSYDIESGVEREVTLPSAVPHIESLQNDRILLTRHASEEGREVLDGWVWTHADGAKRLINPDAGFVFDLESDGEFLVWTTSNGEQALEWHDVEVWRSPLVYDEAEVQATKLGTVPNTRPSYAYGHAQNGYYAVIEGSLSQGAEADTRIHLFRLGDGFQVQLPKPEDTQPGEVLYIDSEEIWYFGSRDGITATIIRQRLADL